MKLRVTIRGRAACQECNGSGHTIGFNRHGIRTAIVCKVCRGMGDHPGVLLIPCVDIHKPR